MGTSIDAVLDRRYRLTQRLGRGGMADVWAADDLVLHRPVAVKVFRFDLPGTEQARIDAEMRMIGQLSHPGIVSLFDAGTADDPSGADGARTPYLVMELVHGQTLHDRLAQGPLPPDDVRELGVQLADTFGYLHGRGVVHRDVKPANILLQPVEDVHATFRTRLTDFGIARLADSARITEIGMTMGTANYLSPEQAVGANVGPPSDVYSLGLVLLECFTGEVAYPGTGVAAATARLYHPPAIPHTLERRWAALLTAMTAPEPGDRPTPAAIAAELARSPEADPAAFDAIPAPPAHPTQVISGGPTPEPAGTRLLPTPGAPAPARSPGAWWTKPVVWAALLGVVVLVVLIAVFAGGSGSDAPSPQPSNAPNYPAVGGQVGQHLRQLESAVG